MLPARVLQAVKFALHAWRNSRQLQRAARTVSPCEEFLSSITFPCLSFPVLVIMWGKMAKRVHVRQILGTLHLKLAMAPWGTLHKWDKVYQSSLAAHTWRLYSSRWIERSALLMWEDSSSMCLGGLGHFRDLNASWYLRAKRWKLE